MLNSFFSMLEVHFLLSERGEYISKHKGGRSFFNTGSFYFIINHLFI